MIVHHIIVSIIRLKAERCATKDNFARPTSGPSSPTFYQRQGHHSRYHTQLGADVEVPPVQGDGAFDTGDVSA